MKRVIAVLVSFFMLAGVCKGVDFKGHASENVSSDYYSNSKTIVSSNKKIDTASGETIKIPVTISNNTGLLGFKLMFSYDEKILTPISIEYGNCFNSGLQDNIEGDAIPGEFCVYWTGNKAESFNGTVFYIKMSVDNAAFGSTHIGINYSIDDTFDDNFNSVELECNDIDISVSNESVKSYCSVEVLSETDTLSDKGCAVISGQTIYVTKKLERSNDFNNIVDKVDKDHQKVKYNYDVNAFEFLGFYIQIGSDRVIYDAEYVSTNDGIVIDYSDFNTYTGLAFKAKSDALSATYQIEILLDREMLQRLDYYECKPLVVTVLPSSTSDIAEVYIKSGVVGSKGSSLAVPIIISNNHGIMGYKLKVEYDSTQIQPMSVTKSSNFTGNFNDTIGQKDGEFYVLWNSTQNVTLNGSLMTITFNVVTDKVCESNLKLSYVQSDTFNEQYDDVIFLCKSGNVYLNCSHRECLSKVVNPTCTEDGYTIYTCTTCKYSYIVNNSPALGHNWNTGEVVKKATCAEPGIIRVTCNRCKLTKNLLPPIVEHNWNTNPVIKAATCTVDGSVTYTCDQCKTQKSDIIPAEGHSYANSATTSATCVKDGAKTFTCTKCGEIMTQKLPATGHRYTAYTKKPTCSADGYTIYTCTKCKSSYKSNYVKAKGHAYKLYLSKATTKKDGMSYYKCSVCGATSGKKKIYKVQQISLSSNEYIYDGKNKRPSVVVKTSKNINLVNGVDYTVSYPKASKNVGVYTMVITFKGNYSGVNSYTYSIVPKTTTITKVKSYKKSFKLSWKKQSSQTTGYQIQYSTSKNFKNGKTVVVSDNKTTSKSVSKLKAKKKYYVRIRTYKAVKINNKSTKIYSDWSKAKTIKTK